ncbi:MAG: ATP-binding domain-containing protein, partial [Prevotella sp.]|nr:ATP-binding domain-containing protein [Prevotella sp.]
DHIGIREILHGLLTKAASPLLLSEESKCPVIVTNIHRGKGREFETVLLEDSIFSEKEKTLEEHKVNYVAITRS